MRSPLNTADFSSYLLAAQGSGAKVVVFAITGADLSNALKQANEFGLSPGQYLATPITYLSDVNAIGLDVAHGLTFMQSWYWDLNDKTRDFAKRFFDRTRPHAQRQPGRALFLRAPLPRGGRQGRNATTRRSRSKAMRAAPIHDVFTADGKDARGRAGDLRPLPHEGEDARGIEIPVGLSVGRRQDSGRATRSGRLARAAARWRRPSRAARARERESNALSNEGLDVWTMS